eukprot:10436467-Lingulodinium_polyedra.AAC.1
MVSHVPFRSRCPFCTKGKAKSSPHRRRQDEGSEIPVISMDYALMKARGDEDDEMESPILVVKDRKTKSVSAHLLPRKGADPYAAARVV